MVKEIPLEEKEQLQYLLSVIIHTTPLPTILSSEESIKLANIIIEKLPSLTSFYYNYCNKIRRKY